MRLLVSGCREPLFEAEMTSIVSWVVLVVVRRNHFSWSMILPWYTLLTINYYRDKAQSENTEKMTLNTTDREQDATWK